MLKYLIKLFLVLGNAASFSVAFISNYFEKTCFKIKWRILKILFTLIFMQIIIPLYLINAFFKVLHDLTCFLQNFNDLMFSVVIPSEKPAETTPEEKK